MVNFFTLLQNSRSCKFILEWQYEIMQSNDKCDCTLRVNKITLRIWSHLSLYGKTQSFQEKSTQTEIFCEVKHFLTWMSHPIKFRICQFICHVYKFKAASLYCRVRVRNFWPISASYTTDKGQWTFLAASFCQSDIAFSSVHVSREKWCHKKCTRICLTTTLKDFTGVHQLTVLKLQPTFIPRGEILHCDY